MKCLPTDNIIKLKGTRVTSRCDLCKIDEDTIDHVFWTCTYNKQIWFIFRELLNWSHLVNLTHIHDVLKETCAHDGPRIGQLLPFLICWHLWFARNKAHHENEAVPPMSLVEKFLLSFTPAFKLNVSNRSTSPPLTLGLFSNPTRPYRSTPQGNSYTRQDQNYTALK